MVDVIRNKTTVQRPIVLFTIAGNQCLKGVFLFWTWFALQAGATILIVGLVGSPVNAQSTKRFTNWYFGYSAGITFNGATPQVLTTGKLRSEEGCAAMSDPNGQLLFYTDGNTIWNKNHDVMPGAVGLGGSTQSTQSALIVPYQTSTSRFYVFSVATGKQQTGIQYAVVDMNLMGGLGGLESKNMMLFAPSTEKITVIKHCNNLNHWIVTHEQGNNVFRVYLLNDNGLILTPKLYRVGSIHQPTSKGYMKPSHDGQKLAVAVSDSSGAGFLELVNFDNKTGAITNAIKLETPETAGAYGVEFSADNKQLYLSTMLSKKIYQLGAIDLLLNTTLTVASPNNSSSGIGALQLGPDGKIYGAIPGENYLMAINQPNQFGSGCDLVAQAVNLGGKTAMAGLPFCIDEVVRLPPELTISQKKLGGCNKFLLESHPVNLDPNYLLYQWYVDGVAITSGGDGPTCQPTKSGTYLLQVRELKCDDIHQTSNKIKVIIVEVNPVATAIPDSCGTFLLAAHASGGVIQWSGSGIDSVRGQRDSITVSGINGSQTYRVRAASPEDATCFSEKEVTVTFTKPSPFQLTSPERTGCGDTLTVNVFPTSDWNTFRWLLPDSREVTGTTIVARQSGQYHLTALSTASGCKSVANLTVTLNPNPALQLLVRQIDTCFVRSSTSAIELDAGAISGVSYTWTTGGKTLGSAQRQTIRDYGLYTVTVRTTAGCQTSDSIRVISSCPPVPPMVTMPDAFTPNNDGMNERLVIYGSGVDRVTLTIYDRWGEVLYKATEVAFTQSGWETWDGTYRGKTVASGLYVYRLDITNPGSPKPFSKEGLVELIR